MIYAFQRLLRLLDVPDRLDTIDRKLNAMTSHEQEQYARLTGTIESVKTGWAALVAERDQYRSALETADADKARAVEEALAADSEHDADAIAAANDSLSTLVAVQAPVEPLPEQPAPGEPGTEPTA